MSNKKNIWIVGHNGMVGSSLQRLYLEDDSYKIISIDRAELDLLDQLKVKQFYKENNIDEVILCAAKVGGIYANNTYPADFIYQNLMIECNVIHGAFDSQVKKLLFLGSSCIYPKFAEQPIKEEQLLTGSLESTNQWYAIAKIAGLKLCEAYRKQHKVDYISAMPTNLYGPGDNFHLENSHVIPALIKKCHHAKENQNNIFEIWGSGTSLREFLHVDDLSKAIKLLMNNYSKPSHINIGSGEEVTIKDLASIIADVVGFKGDIVYDSSKPDGTPRKLLDSEKIFELGWKPEYSLKSGLIHTYEWYQKNIYD